MIDINTDIIIATVGVFLGEIYGNFVGGGSLVTQIALQNIIGLPVKEAMALDNAAVIGSNIGMMTIMIWYHKFKWWMIPFIIFQIIGAYLGVELLIWIPENLLQGIFIFAIIALIIKSFFFNSSSVKKELGFEESIKNILFLCLSAIFIGLYNAAFVIGDWIISLMILTTFFHFKYHKALWLLVVSMIIAQPFATYGYIQNNLVDFNYLLPMIGATLMAGLIAGYFFSKINALILEKILQYLSIFLVIYLIYGILN